MDDDTTTCRLNGIQPHQEIRGLGSPEPQWLHIHINDILIEFTPHEFAEIVFGCIKLTLHKNHGQQVPPMVAVLIRKI